VQEMPELIWLEAIPLSLVAVTGKEDGRHEHHPDWSKATVRVGSRVPSRTAQALIAACDPRHPLVTQREALERLAVLRILLSADRGPAHPGRSTTHRGPGRASGPRR
jgi:hypothetical protein